MRGQQEWHKSGTRVAQNSGKQEKGTREGNKRGEQECKRWNKNEIKVETKESDKHEASKKKKVRR